ncbi:alpha/beta fold hydrolase [Acidovorax sp. LjRoot129]|uniref:alpha/beta hydrolase n=1 Tax=Acidovorax sp. LjRoot129 TaxID=3342260 RepID=UPI003ECCD50C
MFQRLILITACASSVIAAVLYFGAGELLSRPALRLVGKRPSDFPAKVVRIDTAPGQFVVGWFAPGEQSRGAVLLLHGIRADRTQMLRRARFLARAGYSTLLIDLPAHGESSGDRITFGARESAGVLAAVGFLRRELPRERLGIIGVSLGAASTLLARPQPAADAVVIESMYPTIEEAVNDRLRMRLGKIGAVLGPVLLWQLPLRTGVRPADLRPIEKLPTFDSPLLVASGSDDEHTTWAETQRIYDAAEGPKEIWQVLRAKHVDLHSFQPEEYERRILRFLAKYVRNEI